MPLRQEERALYVLAKEYIATGKLPRTSTETVFASRGTDSECVLCGKAIGRIQTEYQIAEPEGDGLRLHIRCHVIWRWALSNSVMAR
jgi:hypothetical protein